MFNFIKIQQNGYLDKQNSIMLESALPYFDKNNFIKTVGAVLNDIKHIGCKTYTITTYYYDGTYGGLKDPKISTCITYNELTKIIYDLCGLMLNSLTSISP